jgi:hypothetical protein
MYDSRCLNCGETFTTYRRMADCDDLPECCGVTTARVYSVPMVSADIAPYQAVGYDKKTGGMPFITSRREHKEYLRRNGYHEVETSFRSRNEVKGDFDMKRDLINAVKKVTGH